MPIYIFQRVFRVVNSQKLVVKYVVTTSEQCNISFTKSLNNTMYLLTFTSAESLRPDKQG